MKSLEFRRGEQQVGARIEDIRPDHVARYRWAAKYLQKWILTPRMVFDAACGVGYGTSILADALPDAQIFGVDIHPPALEYARQHWRRANCSFTQLNLQSDTPNSPDLFFDAVVSFETLEHLSEYQKFARAAFAALRPGGEWIVSVPNEAVIPFKLGRWPFHVRHFTPIELGSLLQGAGFKIGDWYGQRRYENEVTPGTDGAKHIICIATKP